MACDSYLGKRTVNSERKMTDFMGEFTLTESVEF